MDTLYWIGLIILFVYSCIATRIVFVMRKDLMQRKPKGKLYLSSDEIYCEFTVTTETIRKSEYVTLKVIDTDRRN